MRAALTLGVFVLLVAGAAFVGAQFTPGPWYQSLRRPPLAPPNWIFGPVWSVLYLAIAVAAFLVWRSPERGGTGTGTTTAVRLGLGLWATQLALNALWSYLFFGLERPGVALVEIVLLLATIIATAVVFFSVSRAAGLLFVPYIAWVSFATYLNAGFWWLNRGGPAG